MTIVPSTAVTSARAPRPAPRSSREHNRLVRWGVDPNRVRVTAPTAAQWDLLEYAYEEQCHRRFTASGNGDPGGVRDDVQGSEEVAALYNPEDKHPVVAVIPPSSTLLHGVASSAYQDACILRGLGLVELSTPNARVGASSPRQTPWLYTWAVRLTDEGEKAVRARIARRPKLTRQRQAAEAVARMKAPRPQAAP
jgi:hypothetical protein